MVLDVDDAVWVGFVFRVVVKGIIEVGIPPAVIDDPIDGVVGSIALPRLNVVPLGRPTAVEGLLFEFGGFVLLDVPSRDSIWNSKSSVVDSSVD